MIEPNRMNLLEIKTVQDETIRNFLIAELLSNC